MNKIASSQKRTIFVFRINTPILNARSFFLLEFRLMNQYDKYRLMYKLVPISSKNKRLTFSNEITPHAASSNLLAPKYNLNYRLNHMHHRLYDNLYHFERDFYEGEGGALLC